MLQHLRTLKALAALTAGVLALAPAQGAHAAHVDGAWSEVHDWPLIAIHAALTPDGRVLTYGTTGTGQQTGYFIYDIWDPLAGLEGGHLTLDNMTLTDIFCSSQIILPQSGDILIAGGDNWTGTGTTNTGNNNSNLFDYGDDSLSASANMHRARWYSSATALVNGEIYIQGGTGGGDLPEVRQLDGDFRLLTTAPTNGYAVLFPRNFLAPDGRVFGYDTAGRMYYVDAGGTGSIVPAGQFPSANAGWTSGAAMYRPGRILQMGGNSNGALVIDINGPQPEVQATQSMSSKRMWVSATVLPDGQVLGTGGSEVANQLVGVNNSAEIWNPATGSWHTGSAGEKARLYHSSALLLPDATVLVAGGGAPGPLSNTNAEIYYPPYLFDTAGLAERPQILSATDTASAGDSLAIEVDSPDVERVTLVRAGSVTHSVNMDQRFLELPFSASGNLLQAALPSRASDLPPGFYLTFVIDAAGVPSEGRMLRINIDATPDTAVDYTPAIGGGGGAPFQLACNADEILVGVHGRYQTYVNQVGPQCVAMDQLGRWIGDPVDRPVTGGTASGPAFSRTCPRDFALSGFRGRAGQYVNELEIECRALTADGKLGGAGQYLGADGGSGGSPQGPYRCGTDNPAYALYGRSGGRLDSFGVQCRQGVITPISINSEPVIVNPGGQDDIVGLAADLQLAASDGDDDPLTFSAAGLPPGVAIDEQTGLISGVPTSAGDYSVTVTVSDGEATDDAAFDWSVSTAPPLSVEPMPARAPALADSVVTFEAQAQGGANRIYKWNFGDGSPETAYASVPSVEHSFGTPGIYYVTLTVNDEFGMPHIQTFVQTVHLPLTDEQPAMSGNVAWAEGASGKRLWIVNPDNDSVSVFDAGSYAKLAEISVGDKPRAVAVAPDDRVWVTNRDSASISIVDPVGLSLLDTVALPYGSRPEGVAFAPDANAAFVVLSATGELLKLDGSTGAALTAAAIGANARHLAINSNGSAVYVSRFITPPQPGEDTALVLSESGGMKTGGEIAVVDAGSMTVVDTIVLRHGDKTDGENQGSGVPNYLGAMAISPDGTAAWVPSKQDNIGRGTLRSGAGLNFQSTVRAISSRIDLQAGAEDYDARLDHDNASLASAAVFDPLGVYLFVALETSREVAVVDVHGRAELFRVDVGRAPQGLTLSADGLTLYVSNFMDRSVDVYDLAELRAEGNWNMEHLATLESVGTEKLTPEILRGKQLFYDARDTRLARDRYMSCASCHSDGGHDGRVWDLTGLGEGLRNTISLEGSAGGRLHWTRNFDEVQDFEGQIRRLAGGTGLMADADFLSGTRSEPLGDPKAGISPDLDALAAYVESLAEEPGSPYRADDGSLTADAAAGREVFRRENCAACHGGVAFSDSDADLLHDIGTLGPASGKRLWEALTGVDTPGLRGVWSTAPYLHDGSAATLAEAVAAHDGVALDPEDAALLVAYLKQIDAREGSAPLPNVPPELKNPGDQSHEQGDSVDLALSASDADGDALSFSASGLPAGLAIDSATGTISGTLASAGTLDVTIEVDDGIDSVSSTFRWSVTASSEPDPDPGPGPGDDGGASGGGGSAHPYWLLTLAVHFGLRRGLPLRSDSMRRPVPIALLALLLLSSPSYAALPEPERVRVLQTPVEVPDTALIDEDGNPCRLSDLRGRVALVFFGFTNCPDVCPMALNRMRLLERSGGGDLAEVAYVMISVDGERDEPQVLKDFLDSYSPRFIGLTGQPDALKSVAAGFRAAFFKGSSGAKGYTVSHSPQIFAVDAEGRLRAEFYDATTEAMREVTQALLQEAKAESP